MPGIPAKSRKRTGQMRDSRTVEQGTNSALIYTNVLTTCIYHIQLRQRSKYAFVIFLFRPKSPIVPTTNLAKASVLAVKWSALTTAARFGLQLVSQIVLARILGPENYGLFGIGLVVYTFGNFFSSFGFGRNLLHKSEVSPEDIRFAFTWQTITGAIAMLAIYGAAPSLAEYFNEPRVLPVIRWLSLACLLNAMVAPANNLIQRNLNFKATGAIQVASYALGYLLIGIPMALNDMGVHALVAAWLTQSIFTLIATFWLHPHSLRPLLWFPEAREAFGYGSTVFITNIVNWLLNNLDRVVIGRLLNAQAVGLYTAGYNLATLPNSLLLGSMQSAFLASGAKVGADSSRLRAAYLQILASIWVILLPAFVFLSLLSPQIVALLYGPRWTETGEVLGVLFLAMPAFITWGLSTPILWNSGRTRSEFLLQIPVLVASTIALYAFAGQGLRSAAIITLISLILRGTTVAYAAGRAIDLDFREVPGLFARGATLAVLSSLCALIAILATENLHQPLLTLVAATLLALLVFALVWRLLPSLLGSHAQTMLNRFLPASLHARVPRPTGAVNPLIESNGP